MVGPAIAFTLPALIARMNEQAKAKEQVEVTIARAEAPESQQLGQLSPRHDVFAGRNLTIRDDRRLKAECRATLEWAAHALDNETVRQTLPLNGDAGMIRQIEELAAKCEHWKLPACHSLKAHREPSSPKTSAS